ncbi:hypothetical protein [Morganella morganii]|uniref:hypothetical protein n=1 Tax=Morganella morganii TaxID=582 RepID=UPI003D7FD9D3
MTRSSVVFDRWKPRSKSSWPWRVFKKHNVELQMIYTVFDTSSKFTYEQLGKKRADLTDLPTNHFKFDRKWEAELFTDLNEWSASHKELRNWVNLNALLTISANLETYMSTIIPLALESDIGILYGVTHRIDGVEILKRGTIDKDQFKNIAASCTSGEWPKRISAYTKCFGVAPKYISNDVISALEKIRKIRNDIAHAFGRDIESSRISGQLTTKPITRLSTERLYKFQSIVWKTAKAIDAHLLHFHIGEFQALKFYHELYPTLDHSVHPNQRARILKQRIGGFGDVAAGVEFCRGLVQHYENF